MEKLITRTMSALCLSLLAFYAYGMATAEHAEPWTPPSAWICFDIGGGQYCVEIPDEWQ